MTTHLEPDHKSRLARFKTPIIALNAVILLVLVGGTAAYAGMSETVKLTVDGKTSTFRTFGETVDSVLASRKVELGEYDAVSPKLSSTDIDEIRVDHAEVRIDTKTVAIAFQTQSKNDSTLEKGAKKVLTPGKAGAGIETWKSYLVNGKVVHSERTHVQVTAQPSSQVVAVGTLSVTRSYVRYSGGGWYTGDPTWDRIIRCESGGNPRAVNPAGYYGLFQFSLGTWHSLGYSGNPIDYPPETQFAAAQKLQARSGWGQWGCY